MNERFSGGMKAGACALAWLLVLTMFCCTPWRANPHDQERCEPACAAGKSCFAGRCVAADAGLDAGLDGLDMLAPDLEPDVGPACTVCGANCLATCGNGTCDPAESCAECPVDCTCGIGSCGDGVRNVGEACDDGNRMDDDLCSNACESQHVRVDTSVDPLRFARYSLISAVGDGTYAVLWRDGRTSGLQSIKLRRFDGRGVRLDGAKVQVTPSAEAHCLPVAVLPQPGGRLDVLWVEESELVWQPWANACVPSPLGPKKVLSPWGATAALQLPSDGLLTVFASSAIRPSSDESGTAIYLQRFNSAGVAVLPDPELVNSSFVGDQRVKHSAVALLDGGGFVIAWTDPRSDPLDSGVRARLYKSDGSSMGPDFALNAITDGEQRTVILARLAGVGFVAVWRDSSDDTGDIRFRRFSPLGDALDQEELQANTTTDATQTPTHVVSNAQGDFLILWEDWLGCKGGCSENAARGRIFDQAGSPRCVETGIAAWPEGNSGSASAVALPSGDFLVVYPWSKDPAGQPPMDLYLRLFPRSSR
ncbi:MAG: hypothetical protein JRH20_16860 [Deltaproteobacteria bacterium]|nr:hypothetical protein [Deltaproteobacteria bacterium]